MISYDLETNPLQIKTDSTSGSGEIVLVTLYTAGGESVEKLASTSTLLHSTNSEGARG